jgi:hypothetical protein
VAASQRPERIFEVVLQWPRLAKEDLRALSEVKRMSETSTVAGWSTPPGWPQRMVCDADTGQIRPVPPPGAGEVLVKLGERACIQTQVKLTPTELRLHDTNERWITEGTVRSWRSAGRWTRRRRKTSCRVRPLVSLARVLIGQVDPGLLFINQRLTPVPCCATVVAQAEGKPGKTPTVAGATMERPRR